MDNRLIIDSRDIGAYYNAYVTDQALNGVLSWPASKPVDIADWAERDFVEADLSDLRLDAKEMSIDFALRSHPSDIVSMCSWLAGSIARTWNFASIGREYELRYVGSDGIAAWPTIQTFGVSVSEDKPMEGYEYLAPVSHIPAENEYSLDGAWLTDYGVRVLFGTLDTTSGAGGVKERLRRNISVIDGVIYDNGAENALRGREIVLKCVLIDPTLAGAWRNYDALLHDLTKKNMGAAYDTDQCKRTLFSHRLNRAFDCFYKSQSVTGFYPDGGRIWILFDIVLSVVGEAYVPGYLATESDEWVKTENGYRIWI